MKFGNWLEQHVDENSRIGDLARDMVSQNDVDVFNAITDPTSLPFHICNVEDVVIEAFNLFQSEQ